MFSEKELQTHYQQLDNDKIIKLAEKESKSLQEFVIPILKNEIQKRNLDPTLINWIDFERDFFKGKELKNLKNKIAKTPCSKCQSLSKIKGAKIEYIGLLEDTYHGEVLLCQNCIRKLRRKSYFKTITIGWVSWGSSIISVPFYFMSELFSSFQREKISQNIIENFIFENTGYLRKNGIENIGKIISTHNKKALEKF